MIMDKPQKPLADYVMVAISPILIMALVGSLAFFLIQVFYRGEMVQGVRWTIFWFVLAIVLVSRIGIELGEWHGRTYGALLAIATWIYLVYTQKAPVIGAILLVIIWWCAHRLTLDCTRVREDGPSAEGVFRNLCRSLASQGSPLKPLRNGADAAALELIMAARLAAQRNQRTTRRSGRGVLYFSLAALPLFGIGQTFLPADDPHARHIGFAFLVLYLGSAFSLLATTSFLGLRRKVQRFAVELPADVTTAWIKFGALLAGSVLLLAGALPRPGGLNLWRHLAFRIPHPIHRASDLALPFNAPGMGEGRPATQPLDRTTTDSESKKAQPGVGGSPARNDNPSHANAQGSSSPPGSGNGGSHGDGSSGGQGTRSQTGRARNDGPQANVSVPVKDVAPTGNAKQSSDDKANSYKGEPREPDADGLGNEPQIKQSTVRNQLGKAGPSKPVEKPQRPAVQTQPPDQPQLQPNQNAEAKRLDYLLYLLLRLLVLLAVSLLLAWLLIRFHKALARTVCSAWAAGRDFFRRLFRLRWPWSAPASDGVFLAAVPDAPAVYQNPFLTGKDKSWPWERLLCYTYEAMQAWAEEFGVVMKPQQTPREFCCELMAYFPDVGPELDLFSVYYTHVAFAKRLPDGFETNSLRQLWKRFGDAVPRQTRTILTPIPKGKFSRKTIATQICAGIIRAVFSKRNRRKPFNLNSERSPHGTAGDHACVNSDKVPARGGK